MRISTKGRYGLRAIVDIAAFSKKEHVSLKSIAERQGISEAYLEQMFATLRKAGIVKSVKGPQGGYFLADSPENITVGSILRVLEGDLNVIEDESMLKEEVPTIEYCVQKSVWEKMNYSLNSAVDSITIAMLLNDYMVLRGKKLEMYYI